MSASELSDATELRVQVWDKDTVSKDDFLGQVTVDLRGPPSDSSSAFVSRVMVPVLTCRVQDSISVVHASTVSILVFVVIVPCMLPLHVAILHVPETLQISQSTARNAGSC